MEGKPNAFFTLAMLPVGCGRDPTFAHLVKRFFSPPTAKIFVKSKKWLFE